jgi:hypothetical protein
MSDKELCDTPQDQEKGKEENGGEDKKDGKKEGEDKPDWVKVTMERNAAKAKRRELERKMANDGVKRSYRLKSKS